MWINWFNFLQPGERFGSDRQEDVCRRSQEQRVGQVNASCQSSATETQLMNCYFKELLPHFWNPPRILSPAECLQIRWPWWLERWRLPERLPAAAPLPCREPKSTSSIPETTVWQRGWTTWWEHPNLKLFWACSFGHHLPASLTPYSCFFWESHLISLISCSSLSRPHGTWACFRLKM